MKYFALLSVVLTLALSSCISLTRLTPSQAAELGTTPQWLSNIDEITVNGEVLTFTATGELHFVPGWSCWMITGTMPHPKAKKAAKGKTVGVSMTYYPQTQQGYLFGHHKYTKVGKVLRCLPDYAGDPCFDDITIEE